jgi:hypothetical protein
LLLGTVPDLKEVVLVVGNGTRSESSGSYCWEWYQIWKQWFLLLGMVPYLKAVVLLRNVSTFCRRIVFDIGFCDGFCMPVKIISNAKYRKINPKSYLSDEISNIWDSWCGDYTDLCRKQCDRWWN